MVQNSFILSNLNFDYHENLRKEDSLVYYLRNGDVSDYTNTENLSFVQNANSNELCVKFPENFEYRGYVKLDLDEYIIFLQNSTTSAIYLFNQERCTLIEIVRGECLNFTKFVRGRFKFYKGKRKIYFGNSDFIYELDLSDIPRQQTSNCDDCNNTVFEALDCNKLKLFKDFTPPNIDITTTSGNIPDGVYQIAISRTEEDDNDSWFIYSDRINLHGINGKNERFGLNLKFDCVDWIGEFKLALIAHREDRGIIAQEIGIYTTKTKSVAISELDATYYFPISNQQLYQVNPVYQGADYIVTNTEHLVLGKLTERKSINYQRQANLIKSNLGIFKVNSKYAHLYPSFQSNENYAFEIQGLYKDNQVTDWFHIPNNNVPDSSWFANVNNGDTWTDVCNPITKKKYQVYNSATLLTLTEDNDNGSLGVYNNVDPLCKQYKITTTSNWWQGTLTYTDCEGYEVILEDILPNHLSFCTNDISLASWVFKPFDKNTDLLVISEQGQCTTNSIVNATCTKYKLSDRFKAFTGTNCGTINYDTCTQIALIENCGVPTTFTGNISDFNFCACYPNTDPLEIVIDVLPCAYTFDLLGQCGSNDIGGARNANCDFKLVGTSTFAYYESDIKYSNFGGINGNGKVSGDDLFSNLPNYKACETGIRYHKFPDRTQTLAGKKFPHIHSTTDNAECKEFVYILAPRFYDIPPFLDCYGNIDKDIIGYRIGYKSRENNKSVIHSGVLYNMREETLADCTKSYYPNYPFNDLNPDDFIGTYEYVKAGNVDARKSRGRFVAQTAYSKSKFQYISPDIQYKKNDQEATELITLREENGYVSGEFNKTEEIPSVVILSDAMYSIMANLISLSFAIDLIPFIDVPFSAFEIAVSLPETLHKLLAGKNYAYNILTKSNYTRSNTVNIVTDNRRRQIKDSFYLQPFKQQYEGIKINNAQREGSLYLNLNSDLADPLLATKEKSRDSYRNISNLTYSDKTQTNYKTSSYYVQLRKDDTTQYGGLYDGLTIPISNLITTAKSDSGYLIAGDIYITKHNFYKKFPFFNRLPLNAPFDTPYIVSDTPNVGYPHYWLDVVDRNELLNVLTKNKIARIAQTIIGYSGNNFYLEPVNNPIKRNCTQGSDNKYDFGLVNGIFYTHIIGEVSYYCESEYIGAYREINEVPQSDYNRDNEQLSKYNTVLYPEMFLYNRQQLSKGVYSQFKNFDLTKNCCEKTDYAKNRLIFSLKNDSLNKSDKWTKFLPKNYHQFSEQDGQFQGIFELNNYNLIFVFDNAAYLTETGEGLLTNGDTVYLGVGSIFERRLKEISSRINGLGGCIDLDSIVNTPFGAFWADRTRKTFVHFDGSRLKPIESNLKSFFINWNNKEIKGSYDSFSENVYWSNGDWTVSFKPKMNKWISWHDWKPDNLISTNFNLQTVKNNALWKHNKPNHFQTYYDKLEAFEVGWTINNEFKETIFGNIKIFAEFYKNLDFGQREYVDTFFNKGFVYSDKISSGIKNLEMKGLQNPYQHIQNENIEVTQLVDYFALNGFKNHLEKTPVIKWDNYKYELLNTFDKPVDEFNTRLNGKWFNLHLIAENLPKIKKLVQLNLTNTKDVIK